jgi:hypothetical protein
MTVRSNNLPLVAAALAASALLALSACDSGGGDPPAEENAAPTAEATASADTVTAGQTITLDGADSSDPDGDEMSYSWTLSGPDSSDATFSSQIGVEVQFTADVAGDYDATLLISDGEHEDTDETSAFARQPLPATVVVGFQRRAASGDSLVAGTLVYKRAGQPDSTVAENQADGSLTLPFSETEAELCFQEGTYFRGNCEPITPDADRDLTFQAVRKQVSVSATVDPDDANLQSIIHSDVETEAEGELAAELDKRSGERKLLAFKQGYERDSAMVSADADASESFALEAKPACSNGLDDDDDGTIDARDGGCVEGFAGFQTDADGKLIHYEPADENEVLKARQTSIGSFGPEIDVSVSSRNDDRRTPYKKSHAYEFESSIQKAVGQVIYSLDTKRSADQDGESFALEWICDPRDADGPYTETVTDIVPDENEQDGWELTNAPGLTREAFATGTDCNVYLLHGTLVRGEPAGDGNDDVVVVEEGRNYQQVIVWDYEPEEVSGDSEAVGTNVSDDGRVKTTVMKNPTPPQHFPR